MESNSYNLKLVLSLILTGLLLVSCNYAKNIWLLTGGELERENFVQTIPFDYRKDLIVIKARVNEDNTDREFIFDTGAFESKIEFELAKTLALPMVATKSNSTAQGNTQQIEVTRMDSIRLGETIFSNISAGKLVYDKHSASPCIAPHGIIGANLMKLAHWRIDYQNRKIEFSDEPFVPDREIEALIIPFDKPLLSGTPEIEIKLDGRTISGVLFDLGFNGGLILPAQLSDEFENEDEQTVLDKSTTGIFGTNVDTLTTKKLPVSVGEYTADIRVEFSSIGKALLGNDFLEHFKIFIDYNRKKITLQPQSEIEIEQSLKFIPGMLNDSLWIVNRTTAGSPLQLGDTLATINGKKPSELFETYCDYVMTIGPFLKSGKLKAEKMDKEIVLIEP